MRQGIQLAEGCFTKIENSSVWYLYFLFRNCVIIYLIAAEIHSANYNPINIPKLGHYVHEYNLKDTGSVSHRSTFRNETPAAHHAENTALYKNNGITIKLYGVRNETKYITSRGHNKKRGITKWL